MVDADNFEEFVGPAREVPLPAVANGRITRPGQIDVWKISLKKGAPLEADLRAAYDDLDARTKVLIADKVAVFYSHFTRQRMGVEDS